MPWESGGLTTALFKTQPKILGVSTFALEQSGAPAACGSFSLFLFIKGYFRTFP